MGYDSKMVKKILLFLKHKDINETLNYLLKKMEYFNMIF